MARALLTPDELRRFDNDYCIIFEKGIKPVKAHKYYYFKKPMVRELKATAISHNDIGDIDRGTWRKFNPRQPYVEGQEDKPVQDLKVESLDDLFEEPNKVPEKQEVKPIETKPIEEPKLDLSAPMLPQDDEEELKASDIQKELEAKLDEIFGPLDDSE